MKRNLYFLSLILLTGFVSCDEEDKCTGNTPVFTREESSWLPGKSASSEVMYVNSQGQQLILHELHGQPYNIYEGSKLSEQLCSEFETVFREYYLAKNKIYRFPVEIRDIMLKIQIKKSHKEGFVPVFYWGQMNVQNEFKSFPEQLPNFTVRGNTYRDVYVYTNDITHANDFEGPTTHKLYYAKYFGVVKWVNADGEVWERQ